MYFVLLVQWAQQTSSWFWERPVYDELPFYKIVSTLLKYVVCNRLLWNTSELSMHSAWTLVYIIVLSSAVVSEHVLTKNRVGRPLPNKVIEDYNCIYMCKVKVPVTLTSTCIVQHLYYMRRVNIVPIPNENKKEQCIQI